MLLDSEILRIKAELGYSQVDVGALPYIGYTALFDQVIKPYLTAGATSTSTTTVTAASAPTPVTLTLASVTGFAPFARVSVDVDDRTEVATVSAVDTIGKTITLSLRLDHDGTTGYPVAVDAGEANVRGILRQIDKAKAQRSALATRGGLKRAEDVEWFQGRRGGSAALDDAERLIATWRGELAAALGVPNLWAQSGGATVPVLY